MPEARTFEPKKCFSQDLEVLGLQSSVSVSFPLPSPGLPGRSKVLNFTVAIWSGGGIAATQFPPLPEQQGAFVGLRKSENYLRMSNIRILGSLSLQEIIGQCGPAALSYSSAGFGQSCS